MGKEIGIDLGTTNTIISFVNKSDRIITLKMNNKERVIPSVVYFKTRDDYIIGNQANINGNIRPSCCVRNFKEHIGDNFKYNIVAENGDKFKLTAVQVASKFLSKVIYNMQDLIAKEFSDTDDNHIEKAIITVPAKFSYPEREATKRAGLAANLDNISLMAEPTAGAVAYMEDNNIKDSTILVYDFGGGTFDISLLESKKGICKVLNTDGDRNLGGNNLTKCIVDDMIKIINDDYGWELPFNVLDYDDQYCRIEREAYIQNYSKIFSVCNKIKEKLSEGETEFESEIGLVKEANSSDYEFFTYYYTADEINKLIEKSIDKTIDYTRNMLKWAKERDIKIDSIILIGGSSQLPVIEEKLSEIFPSVIVDTDVSTIVSRGAARVASNERVENNIFECTNAEIGVKSQVGNVFDAFKVIIPDNVKLPYVAPPADFVIKSTDQMKIAIYERDIKREIKNQSVRDKSVHKIDEIIIDELPKNDSSGFMTATIKFTMQKDGSLDLNASIKLNGVVIKENHTVRKASNILDEE